VSSLAPQGDPVVEPPPDESGEPLATLRRWRRPVRPARECCDLCGEVIGPNHSHLFEPAERRVSCACDACAVLFSGDTGRFRRVPRRIRALSRFHCPDDTWSALKMPIDLAFFSRRESATSEQPVIALYPSPAGATEALPDPRAWRELVEANPEVADLEPDVEALLVNRVGKSRQAFLCPIDECYRLVGLVRMHWRGLSGGAKVWGEIERFFVELQGRASAWE
jgi:hypothetical protein